MEQRTKYVLIGLGLLAAGTGAYFWYKQKEKGPQKTADDFKDDLEEGKFNELPAPKPKPSKVPSGYKPAPANSVFPLKRKSKGTLVKDVQNALIKHYGSDSLPKYGPDGFYGEEMETALAKYGISSTIDAPLYAKIITGKAGNKAPKADKKDDKKPAKTVLLDDTIADLIYSGIIQKNISTVLRGLWKIKNVTHYIKVNEKFKQKEFDYVSKTIPTALSDAFPFDPERKKYRAQLYTIGLKWRNNKWALAGFLTGLEDRLVTIKRAKIWDAKGKALFVPAQTLIGLFVRAKNGLTEFETLEGRHLFVETTSIKYHHD
jgi:hypothetical protein